MLLVLALTLVPMVGCAEQEPLEIVSCGSGFYFNRPSDKTYKIEALDAESTGNYFYLENYFVSDQGQEYAIKDGWFEAGTVKLAKKSDFYSPESYTFDLAEYNNSILEITSEMNYVKLTSSAEEPVNVQIQIISGRTTPIDLTLDNVRIHMSGALPAIFSGALTDVNLILVGENSITVEGQTYTVEELMDRAASQLLGDQAESFYDMLDEVKKEFKSGANNAAEGDVLGMMDHFLDGVGEIGKGVVDSFLEGAGNLIEGAEGVAGAEGATAIILPAGVSVSGSGSLNVRGGDGAGGSAATNSLVGDAAGGDGGDGGDGIICNSYLAVGGSVTSEGGFGGSGGEGSKGLLGNSGPQGKPGQSGRGLNVANPKKDN